MKQGGILRVLARAGLSGFITGSCADTVPSLSPPQAFHRPVGMRRRGLSDRFVPRRGGRVSTLSASAGWPMMSPDTKIIWSPSNEGFYDRSGCEDL